LAASDWRVSRDLQCRRRVGPGGVEEGPAERAGKEVDRTVDKVKDAVKK
jgi:hypothetical protein